MDSDVLRFMMVMGSLAVAGGLGYTVIAVANAFVKRLERRWGATPKPAEITPDLRVRLETLDALRDRVAELEERVDFAERLLTRVREEERLPPG